MPPLDHAVQPRAHGFPDLLGHFKFQAALGPRLNDGAGENMMRRLLERGAEHQYLIGRLARRNLDGKQPRAADRQRSGLVEQHGMGARQRLQRPAALDQNAAPGRLRDTGDEGDRRRQNQRTRRRRHQHRQTADQIAGDQPGDKGEHERQGQENQRIAVGHPHERRFCGLRRGHQAHDARIGAFASGRGHREFKGLAGVQRAGEDGGAARLDHRDRFARQRRLVDGCRSRGDDAVDRNDLARPHQKLVANSDVRYRHVLDAVTGAAMRLTRGAIDQRAQIMLGAGDGDILKHIAAGIHQRDDGTGQRLAQRQRRTHRHQRDRIYPEPPGQQVPHDREREARDDRGGRQRPAEIGEIRPAGGVSENTRRQSRN